MGDNLTKRRGKIIFSNELLEIPSKENFTAIYSNFFPYAITENYSTPNTIAMWGYSPHFKEIEEWQGIPQYEMMFYRDESGIVFDGMVEVTDNIESDVPKEINVNFLKKYYDNGFKIW